MDAAAQNTQDSKISHVENLFIISYLAKALQDQLIQKASFLQYPLLLIDLPLAFAILIVNVERILYVKILGYVMAHIYFDVNILKSMIMDRSGGEISDSENWKERAFDFIRKTFRFIWGLIIFLFILPVWPVILIYNVFIQFILIAVIYYFLMFWDYDFTGGFFIYYILFVTVSFLVSSITVPFIFRLSVYVKYLFSLERKMWRQVDNEAKMAFVNFYQRLYGNYNEALANIKVRYTEAYKAEGGVYYMLLKFLHFLKDKFWTLKEKKIEAVVETIQDKTVEFVDEYYKEKNAYHIAMKSLTMKDLRKTLVALFITISFSVLLVLKGTSGNGIIGPILLSFVDRQASETIWVNQQGGRGYYEDMVEAYAVLPNFLSFIAIGVDTFFNYFFKAYYFLYPLYFHFVKSYYAVYTDFFITGIVAGFS